MKHKNPLILVFVVTICFSSSAQLKMDMELLGGAIINGSKYNYQDDTHGFELKDGFSYGLGFDLWFPCEYSISFGLIRSQSVARTTMNLPSFSTPGLYTTTRLYIGSLIDRTFYLGTKKKFHIGNTTSLSPFLGIYYDFYSFDSNDREASVTLTQNNRLYHEAYYYYARFNRSSWGENKLWGALGGRAGLTLEQDVGRIGKLSLNVSYGIDFMRMNRSTYANYYYSETDLSTGQELISYSYSNNENQIFRRNLLQIELGFKMPCSMEFGKSKGVESL